MAQESPPPARSSVLMGLSAVGVICGVIFTIGKLHGEKLNDMQKDLTDVVQRMQVDDARELRDAEKFGRIQKHCEMLQSRVEKLEEKLE